MVCTLVLIRFLGQPRGKAPLLALSIGFVDFFLLNKHVCLLKLRFVWLYGCLIFDHSYIYKWPFVVGFFDHFVFV